MALDVFGVLHNGVLTSLLERVLSEVPSGSNAPTNLVPTPFPEGAEMLLPFPNDSRLLSRVVDLSRLTRRDDPSLSWLHPRAWLPEACLDPLSLSVTWIEDVQPRAVRVSLLTCHGNVSCLSLHVSSFSSNCVAFTSNSVAESVVASAIQNILYIV